MSFRPLPAGRPRSRFLVPVAALAAIGLAAWLPTVTASASTPNLPPLTAQQVLTKAINNHVSAFSGSVRWTANLGIPDLSGLTGGMAGIGGGGPGIDVTSLLSGTHTVLVWYDGQERQRLALPGALSEIDLVHNGQQAWYYDSSTDTVTDLVLPAQTHRSSAGQEPAGEPELTPDQIAGRILSHLTPSTSVTVVSPVYVAGRAAYQLVLAPAAGTAGAAVSTVKEIAIAVDAATGMPLRLQVDARGQKAPALQIGFSSLSLSTPSASEFAPRHGSTVRTKVIQGGAGDEPGDLPTIGLPPDVGSPAWGAITTFSSSRLNFLGGQLYQASTEVNGAFGSALLFQTALVNFLILPDGRVLAGFVTPSALEAAAANGAR